MASNPKTPQGGPPGPPGKGGPGPSRPNQPNQFVKKPGPKPKPKRQPSASISTPDLTGLSLDPLKGVYETLDCPVCFEFMSSPIFLCQTGHNLCATCRKSVPDGKCPQCQTPMTGQRNFGLESVSLSVSKMCPNAGHGCSFVTIEERMKAHFEDCDYRQILCPFGKTSDTCMWNGDKKKLPNHFGEVHGKTAYLQPGEQITFENFDPFESDSDMRLVKIDKDKLFLYRVKIDPARSLAFWTVQYVGSEKEANKWKYQIDLFMNKNPKKTLSMSDGCRSADVSSDSVFDSGNCVAVPLFVLKNFVDKKKLTFKFFIRPFFIRT